MFRVRNLVLASALCGYANAVGCYPKWSSGGKYSSGDMVSYAMQQQETKEVACTPNTSGCSAGGKKDVVQTVTYTWNWECISDYWCGSYTPGGLYTSSAWSQSADPCDKSIAITEAPPAAWSGKGCPSIYKAGTKYDAGDVVTVKGTSYNLVYQCNEAPNNLFCGQGGYEPKTGTGSSIAWTELGSCSGTIAPTDSPSFDVIPDAGGCPKKYSADTAYDAGDRVTVNGFVLQCKAWPQSAHCSQVGYEPLTAITDAWKDAWDIIGHCDGTIAPTQSPSFVFLEEVGGCPKEWEARPMTDKYEEGDRVSSNGLVFECKGWPMGLHCGQAGYEPNTDPATPGAWKDAWNVVGWCSGTIGPTSSPSFDPLTKTNQACPPEWEKRALTNKYVAGDMVSVVFSTTPVRKGVFRCKAWPYSEYCMQFQPTVFGGDQGWAYVGGCDGSVGPTQSPSFDTINNIGPCPAEYRKTYTKYEAGDLVSKTVSKDPLRKIVYKCRNWPNTGYCNQAGFAPGSQYADMAWIQMGSCTGSMSPTTAPILYTGNCTYAKTTCAQVTCNKDTTGCSCQSPSTCSTGKVEQCTTANVNVNKWSSTGKYVEGDVVRVSTKRYKCRGWPNSGWCTNSAYKPTGEASGIWTDAWTSDGTCQ